MRHLFFIGLVVLFGCGQPYDDVNDAPVAKGSEEPSLIATDNGLVLSWQEPSNGDIHLKMSSHNGRNWSAASTIASGSDWFVNWADFPAIVANGDKLFVHYLKRTPNTENLAYNIMFLMSQDKGATWSAPRQLHQDTVVAEHGFVSAVPYEDGFYVSWLDGRKTVGNKGKFTLRGVNIKGDGELVNDSEIDDDTCTCCQTSMALVNNVPWSFYRDRTEDEIRDIFYSKMVDGSWTEPVVLHADNWHIPGCPVNGPRAASNNSTLAVAWFTGAEGINNVLLKISRDAGENFDDGIVVDGPTALGRVDIQMDDKKIYVSYLTKNGKKSTLNLKIFSHAGELVGTEIIATVNPKRGTGFPRTAIFNNNLVFAWTDVDNLSVKVLSYPLDKMSLQARARL